MTLWKLCRMGKCIETGVFKRRITGQFILDVIIWIIVGLPVLYLFIAGVPSHRGFFCDDISISYPYKPDTISTKLLLLIGFSASIAVVVIVEILNSLSRKCYSSSSSPDGIVYISKCYAVFLVGFSINQMFVEIIKNEIGALRPNFLDVCRPEYNQSLCPGYITEYRCTGTASAQTIRHSRQSFPSGHSAFTMYIAVYFCFYIYHRLEIKFSCIIKVIIQAAMLLASAVCGFRRITDNKHHMIDVISGFFLGGFIATLMYKTVAERIMSTYSQEKVLCKDEEQSDTCYTCKTNGTDPVTPTPLLSVEYNNGVENGFSNTHPLKDARFNGRKSTPSSNTALLSMDV